MTDTHTTAHIPDEAVKAALAAWIHEDEYNDIRDEFLDDEDRKDDMRLALTAAIPHLFASHSIEVKQLNWTEHSENNILWWKAKTNFGTYSVTNDAGWYATLYDYPYGQFFEWSGTDLSKDTRQTAFDAAQDDFERRVRECIVVSEKGDDSWKKAFAAQSRKLQSVLHINSVKEELSKLDFACDNSLSDIAKPVDVVAVRRQALEEAYKRAAEATKKSLEVSEDYAWDEADGIHHLIIGLIDTHPNPIRALSADPEQGDTLPQDVINLVIAARDLVYSDQVPVNSEERDALDKALEAFSERIDWDDQPDDEASTISEAGR